MYIDGGLQANKSREPFDNLEILEIFSNIRRLGARSGMLAPLFSYF